VARPVLTVYADYTCPYCYLAEHAAAPLRREGVVVGSAAFELRPPGTRLPSAREPWLLSSWERYVVPLAAEQGVVMRLPPLVARTRKAHEAVAYARAEGAHEALHDAIYRAWWEDGLDIGRIDVLVEIGTGVGLGAGPLRVALDIDQWTEAVELEQEGARRLGIDAVPAYLLQREGGNAVADAVRIGLQSYEQLREWVLT
jgi:predicted DsbA family dithiol-disulfide isomerase